MYKWSGLVSVLLFGCGDGCGGDPKMNVNLINEGIGNVHIWEGDGTTGDDNRVAEGETITIELLYTETADVSYEFTAGRGGEEIQSVACLVEGGDGGDKEVVWYEDENLGDDCYTGCLHCGGGWYEVD